MPISNKTAWSESAFFARLAIREWRQYRDVDIVFHPRLTVVTGANGAGKTTLLSILGRHFGWDISFASFPEQARGLVFYASSVWQGVVRRFATDTVRIGTIAYSDGSSDELSVPMMSEQPAHRVSSREERHLNGLYVPSHRPLFIHGAIGSSREEPLAKSLAAYVDSVGSPWQERKAIRPRSPLSILKQTLVYDLRFARAFSVKLRQTLPESLGFTDLRVQGRDVVLETTSGKFTIDAVSGGIAAIIDLTWQILARNTVQPGPLVVVIDEPETHLHPLMQRSILPKLLGAFPDAQFIVASHAPLVVTSVSDASVYVLRYDNEPDEAGLRSGIARAVHSEQLDDFDRAGTANDVLRDVLGLDYTMPDWAARELEERVREAHAAGYTDEALRHMEQELRDRGLERYLGLAIRSIADSSQPPTA